MSESAPLGRYTCWVPHVMFMPLYTLSLDYPHRKPMRKTKMTSRNFLWLSNLQVALDNTMS